MLHDRPLVEIAARRGLAGHAVTTRCHRVINPSQADTPRRRQALQRSVACGGRGNG
jgi:hypothetical protein